MFQNIVLFLLGLIVVTFLLKKVKFTLHARDLIAWTCLVSLLTGSYLTYLYGMKDFQVWIVVTIGFFVISVLLSYYGKLFRR